MEITNGFKQFVLSAGFISIVEIQVMILQDLLSRNEIVFLSHLLLLIISFNFLTEMNFLQFPGSEDPTSNISISRNFKSSTTAYSRSIKNFGLETYRYFTSKSPC